MAANPTGEVHPVADLFPMMSDEELDDLAADIAVNGLIHPIVIDADGQLIDGRNRLAACRLAGIEPTFTSLNGHDPVAFILSANVTRRHLSKGQAAMAVALAQRFVTNQTTREMANQTGVSQSRLVYAMTVQDYAPDLANAVLSGAVSLDTAYAEARKRKEDAEDAAAQLARLKKSAPELADQVVEAGLSLADAMAELARRREEQAERERKEREEREAKERELAAEEARMRRQITFGLNQVFVILDGIIPDNERFADDLIKYADRDACGLTVERLQRCAYTLALMIAKLEKGPSNGQGYTAQAQ